ncbi:MAG: exonuclease SbcCD subunit D C-terminal domain-containing protein [Chloracidobacterium sp.]
MRLLHTSDWHLGATLGDVARDAEHQRFLDWLVTTIEQEQVDALLIAGDIFDTANPPATAQRMYYEFLARCRERAPNLDMVVIGGNHDSAGRLDAPAELLNVFRVRVVGGLPYAPGDKLDIDRLLVPLRAANGTTAAWCIAMPFIRPFDVGAAENFLAGVAALYAECLAAARARRQPGQALIAMGHAFLVGGQLSDTERPIQRGNLDALPVDLFPDDIAYVALGHLHRAQSVAGKAHVRYSGSPLPLSFAECTYQHRVILVDVDGERAAQIRPLSIPRARDLKRIPLTSAASLEEVKLELRQLPRTPTEPGALPPLVEIHIQLDKPEPTLRADIETASKGAWAEIVSIQVHHPSTGGEGSSPCPDQPRQSLDPTDVFLRRYGTKYPHRPDPPQPLKDAFQELLEKVQSNLAEEVQPQP